MFSSQSIIQKRKGLLHPGSGFQLIRLASPANGPQIDMLPEQTLLTFAPLKASLLIWTGSYQSSLVAHVNNYYMTTVVCKLEGCLHKEVEMEKKK